MSSSFKNVGNGLPTRAIGVDGVTKCDQTSALPSSDLLKANSVLLAGDALFSFGGKVAINGSNIGSNAAYKYDTLTNTWTSITSLIQKRFYPVAVRLSENEIIITGMSREYS